MTDDDDLDPAHRALVDFARRVDPRVTRAYARTGDNYATTLFIEVVGAPLADRRSLAAAIKAECRRQGLDELIVIVDATPPDFTSKPKMPEGW